MTIAFTDKRCTIDVHQTSKGFSFEYGNKTYRRRNEEAVHDFFLKEYQANKFDTVKLRFGDKGYYLHFTLDEPEKCTKRQLRAILAQECDGAWCEEKNGKQRYFVKEGWLFPKTKELSQDEFNAYRPTNAVHKAMKFALGALSLVPSLSSHASQATGMGTLLFSIMNTGPALAQMPAIGEFRINANVTYSQGNSAIAALKDGGFVVAWSGLQTQNYDIYGQRYDATGALMGSEFRINTNTTSSQDSCKIAGLNDGGFVVAWTGFQTGNSDIYGQLYDASGVPVGSEFRVNTNRTGSQNNCAIAALSDGGFVVAWEGQQTGNYDIYCQIFDSAGTPVDPEFRINTNTTDNQVDSSLAALNDGGFIAGWSGSQTGNFDIFAQRFNASRAPVGLEFRINTNMTDDQWLPSIAALKSGGFVAGWEGYQTDTGGDIYGQRFDATGASVGAEFRINTDTTNTQQNPTVAALNDGGFIATWEGLQTLNADVYSQRYDASGTPMGSEFRINTNTTGNQNNPTIAPLNDGGFIATWDSSQTGDREIYGKRYDAAGSPVLNFSYPSLSSTATTTANFVSSGVNSTLATTDALMSTSQPGSSSTQTFSSQFSSISNPGSSLTSTIMSLTEITYGTDYSLNVNGVSIGTFTITGGTGLYDATQSNTLILQIDPDADLSGQTITLFTVTSNEEGNFETIELEGVSCLSYETQTIQNGNTNDFQIIFQETTCSTGSKPTVSLLPTMLRI